MWVHRLPRPLPDYGQRESEAASSSADLLVLRLAIGGLVGLLFGGEALGLLVGLALGFEVVQLLVLLGREQRHDVRLFLGADLVDAVDGVGVDLHDLILLLGRQRRQVAPRLDQPRAGLGAVGGLVTIGRTAGLRDDYRGDD